MPPFAILLRVCSTVSLAASANVTVPCPLSFTILVPPREATSISRSTALECGNFGCPPNPPWRRSALFSTDSTIFSTSSGPGLAAPPGKRFVVFNRVHHAGRRLVHLDAPVRERIRHRQQHSLKARPPMPVLRRKECSPKVRQNRTTCGSRSE